jgi:hypothetical protein
MIIVPLGVGGGLSKKYYHSNFLIDMDGKRLLLDAGTTVRYSLSQVNIEPESIAAICITHFHHDHVGGLVELLTICYWRFLNGQHNPHRPLLLLRPNQVDAMNGILSPALNNQGLVWQDYCRLKIINDDAFLFEDYILEVIPTDNLHCMGLPSCGLSIRHQDGRNILFSGDIKRLSNSDILAHLDGQTQAIIQDISFCGNPVHATYQEVLHYYPEHFHKKILGTHYEDETNVNGNYAIHLLRQGEPLQF